MVKSNGKLIYNTKHSVMSVAAVIVVVLHDSVQSWLNHLKSHFKQEQDNQPDICQIRFGYRLEIKNRFY